MLTPTATWKPSLRDRGLRFCNPSLEKVDTGVVGTENAYTPEKMALLKTMRTASHRDWLARYRKARKSRGWYYHFHLEVFEDEGEWVGRIWDTIAGKLSHSADHSLDREQSKANILSVARAFLAAQYPDRCFPAADVTWVESAGADADPLYFSLRENLPCWDT